MTHANALMRIESCAYNTTEMSNNLIAVCNLN
jgi:hypothetical protein